MLTRNLLFNETSEIIFVFVVHHCLVDVHTMGTPRFGIRSHHDCVTTLAIAWLVLQNLQNTIIERCTSQQGNLALYHSSAHSPLPYLSLHLCPPPPV